VVPVASTLKLKYNLALVVFPMGESLPPPNPPPPQMPEAKQASMLAGIWTRTTITMMDIARLFERVALFFIISFTTD
jgi:hypothetical protein